MSTGQGKPFGLPMPTDPCDGSHGRFCVECAAIIRAEVEGPEPFILRQANEPECPDFIDLSPHGSRDPLIQRLGVLRAYLDGTGFDTDYDFARTVDEAIQVLAVRA